MTETWFVPVKEGYMFERVDGSSVVERQGPYPDVNEAWRQNCMPARTDHTDSEEVEELAEEIDAVEEPEAEECQPISDPE